MKSAEIREKFLKFFEVNGHTRVKSSSLVPAADPTLLFTNAGMNQFKDSFLGLTDLGFKRATTAQKCVRAGGKHNDLENVGFTPRHHTFFEMLGNFSFGDYFKKDAIALAWKLLTEEYKLPKELLRVTVFETDDEAFDLWKAQGLRPDWIYRLGEKDNFWAMGDTGPCGPCSEIYYDWGPNYGCGKPDCNPGCPCGLRFLEIWNLVFMQFNRDTSGKMTPLPKPSVDTGAGLERVSSVLQGTYNNYDNDVFKPIIEAIAKRTARSYNKEEGDTVAMRVIADHLRSCTFLMADGVVPSNEGRGYVLRRILRRAIRYGKKLGQEKPFLWELVDTISTQLGSVYPEVANQKNPIKVLIKEEEARFHETIHRGMGILEEAITKVKASGKLVLPGDVAFKLYDSYGFPYDLVEVISKEWGLTVDEKGFNEGMEKQRSQSSWKGAGDAKFLENVSKALENKKIAPTFCGYEKLESTSKVALLLDTEGNPVPKLTGEGFVIFDITPFYAESGGQVGDKGKISSKGVLARVESTLKFSKVVTHRVNVSAGELETGKEYKLEVDHHLRTLTAINHTATHIMHAALRNVLGDRVKQAGSLVDPERLRFDFTYPRGLSEEELRQIESQVMAEVFKANPVSTTEMKYDDAIKAGALAFFDEKYGDVVRVIRVGTESPFSVELCGGTHLTNSAEIGYFKILSESSVASGVRRIEAITSAKAIEFLEGRSTKLREVERALGVQPEQLVGKIEQLLQSQKTMQKELENLKVKVAQGAVGGKSETKVEKFHDIQAVLEKLPSGDAKTLRVLVDQFRDKYKEKTIVVLGCESDGKAALCVGLTKDLLQRYDAGKIIKELAPEVGGTGGGRPDFAQAGGSNPAGIPNALDKFRKWIMANP